MPSEQPSDHSVNQASGAAQSYSGMASDLERNPGQIGDRSQPDFNPVSRRRRRKGKVVSGNATSGNSFAGAPKTRHVFLYRVHSTVGEEDVSSHMNGKDMKYLSLRTMSNPEAMFKSFLITVILDQFDNFMNPDMWPSGSKLREFTMPPGGLRYNNSNGSQFT